MNLLSLNSDGAFLTTIHSLIPHNNRHNSAETNKILFGMAAGKKIIKKIIEKMSDENSFIF